MSLNNHFTTLLRILSLQILIFVSTRIEHLYKKKSVLKLGPESLKL